MKYTFYALILFFGINFQALPVLAESNKQYSQLANEYIQFTLKSNPSNATYLGVHDYDNELEDFSKNKVQQLIKSLNDFNSRLMNIDFKTLSIDDQIDYELIRNHIQATLLELKDIRPQEKNPDLYTSSISDSIFMLIGRDFAPLKERLKSVIAREKKIPAVLQTARDNLKNPPAIYTKIALEQLPGAILFFKEDVPKAFSGVQDKNLVNEFNKTNQAVIQALSQYKIYLEKEVLANSLGDFKLGPDVYGKKLKYKEMINLPLDKLLEIGYKDLRLNQEWFKKTAREIDANRSPIDILTEIAKDHPSEKELLNTYRTTLNEVKQFVMDKNIVTILSPALPVLRETPPFARALVLASIDPSGPFETKEKVAFFNVTPPESNWSLDKKEEYLKEHHINFIRSTVIHEAYPGHYIQFQEDPKLASKIRKIFPAISNFEGWAHYCEQMVLDEGFKNDNPKMRLAQLHDALLRNARVIVGIKMHTGEMSLKDATDFFVQEAYQSPAMAEREAKRGTTDPTYINYTLGKLEIMKLREDYKKLKGKQFSLKEFHDRFLQMGAIPIRQIRRVLVGNEEGLFNQ